MKYYVVDAFTDSVFQGNPAGVCFPESEIPVALMQKIAFENNLSETAFCYKQADANTYCLRWFTPEVEMDLCGHATLAAAYVVLNFIAQGLQQIDFNTKSGMLHVAKEADFYKMNFPSRMPVAVAANPCLERALECTVLETYLSRDLVVLVENETVVKNLKVNFDLLGQLSKDIAFGIIVTAKGDSCDFVSRFFAPNAGIKEDPVTGSAHSTLIPFWSKRLNKTQMLAKQLSPRGGSLVCENMGERVTISGKAVCYLIGDINF